MKRWLKNWWAWILALVIFVTTHYADARWEKRQDQKLAQAAYDYGKSIGWIIGHCDALHNVAEANPDSVWTANTSEARAACVKAAATHGPGTTDTITLK